MANASTHKYAEELQQLSDFLQSGIELTRAINAPEMAAVKLRLTQSFKTNQNFIHSLLGSARGADPEDVVPTKPVTHMFGEPIIVKQPGAVSKTDTTPTDIEREKFVAEVNDLYANFTSLPVEKIFNLSTLPGGDMKVRAVAKMAGFEGYEDGEIDENYINGVAAAVTAKNKAAADLATSDSDIKSTNKAKATK